MKDLGEIFEAARGVMVGFDAKNTQSTRQPPPRTTQSISQPAVKTTRLRRRLLLRTRMLVEKGGSSKCQQVAANTMHYHHWIFKRF